MKKSEIDVTMPMVAFEELIWYKNKYFETLESIKSCFDTTLFDNRDSNVINLDCKKLIQFAKSKLSGKHLSADIDVQM